MKAAHPYLYFGGDAEEAFDFYRAVFGGQFAGVIRYRDFPGNPMGAPDDQLDRIAHIALPLGGTLLMGNDVFGAQRDALNIGNNAYISLEPETAVEAGTVFSALSSQGRVHMPLQRTDWAECFGMCSDQFGVQWMISYQGDVTFAFPG